MMRADVIDLITESDAAHGVHATVTETARTVYCTVRSATRSEFYSAMNAGVRPEWVFVLALAEDYQGERIVRYKGQKLRVVRTYITESDEIEITCERSDVNGTE